MLGRYWNKDKKCGRHANDSSIIKDYYLEAKKSGARIPIIFGMTASPVDSKEDVVQAAEYATPKTVHVAY